MEYYDILVETPEKIQPGSEIEDRFLKYLMRKYSKKP